MIGRLIARFGCFLNGSHAWTLWSTDRPTYILIRYVCDHCGATRAA